MNSYSIVGGKPLEGSVEISGNKNGALAALCATLLTDEQITLKNIPQIEDVKVMIKLLKHLGSQIKYLDNNSLQIQTNLDYAKNSGELPTKLVDAIRASILLVGPLLSRIGKVVLPPPGGDVIGFRRLDTHFRAIEALGGKCEISSDGFLVVEKSNFKGGALFLEEASVTATENLIMCCVLAEGTTVITNAASEPHIQDLCNLLVLMGAKINGIGSNLITIEGVNKLSSATFTIGSDYMECGSFIGLAAATKGELVLNNVDLEYLPMIANGFSRIGVSWQVIGDSSIVVAKKQSRIIKKSVNGQTYKVDDAPWPGFPADLLSIITVVATQMEGSILIHEKMYESRMYFVDWLIRMGADIILCDPHRAIVNGPAQLKGAKLPSPDVRAAMALVIAALAAEGNSIIQNIYQIERGYEALEEKLIGVGANIIRLS